MWSRSRNGWGSSLCPPRIGTSPPAALRLLIGGYAREPGVRILGHRIDALCRRAVRLRAEGLPLPGEIGPETVAAWLGAPPFRDGEITCRTTGRHSVGPERHDGTDPAGAAARQPGWEEGRSAEDQRHADERQRVERVDIEQQPAQISRVRRATP